jgi:hypothetical protein
MFVPLDDFAVRRLHHELESTIRTVNQHAISEATGAITQHAFQEVARAVACLRGRYLKRVLELGQQSASTPADARAVLELKPLREAYTEAREGFAALEHALERGYVSLAD